MLITFFILLITGVPIAIALSLGAILAILIGGETSIIVVIQKMFGGVNSFPLMAIPLFLLAGNIMTEAKISDKLIALAGVLLGRFRGGLAQASTGASAFFGAISGSSPATVAAVGTITIPSMVKKGYSNKYAASVVAASGVLGIIIPPSINLVLYGVTAGVSVGDLFISSIVPGIIFTLALLGLNFFFARKYNFPVEEKVPGKEKLKIIYNSLLAILMPVLILGGIYSGFFTPTEAAAVACVYGLILGFLVYRTLTLKKLQSLLAKTAERTALIMFLIAASHSFGYIITLEKIPESLASLLLGFTESKVLIMLIILIGLLIIGTFLENIASIILIVPAISSVIAYAEIDPIFFGVFMVIALAVGQITPPVGLNLFVASEIADIKFERILKPIAPYILLYIVILMIFIYFPFLLNAFSR